VICYLDTQVAVSLYKGRVKGFSRRAQAALEHGDLLISPMVLLELEFLHEIGRIIPSPQEILNHLNAQLSLQVCDLAFPRIAETALFETWTRDPFDRMIVAQARANGAAPLITTDQRIQSHYKKALA
jgi:PIN domain nuclease of toxin-antitoxin system